MMRKETTPPLFTFKTLYNTPIHVEKGGLLNWLSSWPLLAWIAHRRHPDWSWTQCVWTTVWAGLALVYADLGHASAHVVSARMAGAPMDEIRVPLGMPRTLYRNNDVSPWVHRMRALGGPVFSLIMLGVSLLVRASLPKNSAAREAADWSCIGHTFIGLGSLTPFPIVDGGTITKWTLVEQGRSPEEADKAVEQAGLAVSGGVAVAGVVMAMRRRWGWAAGLLGLALLGIGMAKGKIA